MELLKQRILQDGRCYPGGILKVDSFINHQMDPMLLYKVAEEFINRFKRYCSGHHGRLYPATASGICKEKATEDNGEYAEHGSPFFYQRS